MEFTKDILEEAENKHYEFQQGCYFSGHKKIDGALLLWSDKIKDFYWNYASKVNINIDSVEDLIRKVVDFYKARNTQPAIYFSLFTKPYDLPEILIKFGFRAEEKECWMFYDKDKPNSKFSKKLKIKKVEKQDDMKTFVNIFNQAYGGATPDEPYGEIPKEYSETLLNSFKPQEGKKVGHYIALLNKKPVGIATIIYSGIYGCFYNIGTSPEARKKGVSTTLTLKIIKDLMDAGVEVFFLQTMEGSYNERYYSKLGFSTKFIGECFVLEK